MQKLIKVKFVKVVSRSSSRRFASISSRWRGRSSLVSFHTETFQSFIDARVDEEPLLLRVLVSVARLVEISSCELCSDRFVQRVHVVLRVSVLRWIRREVVRRFASSEGFFSGIFPGILSSLREMPRWRSIGLFWCHRTLCTNGRTCKFSSDFHVIDVTRYSCE